MTWSRDDVIVVPPYLLLNLKRQSELVFSGSDFGRTFSLVSSLCLPSWPLTLFLTLPIQFTLF